MGDIINTQTGEIITGVTDADMSTYLVDFNQQAMAEGMGPVYAPVNDQRYRVTAQREDGTINYGATIAGSELMDVIANPGATPVLGLPGQVPSEQLARMDREARERIRLEEPINVLGTAVAGAVSGATLGMGDHLLEALVPGYQDTVATAREVNPTADLIGTIGGSLAFTGGAGVMRAASSALARAPASGLARAASRMAIMGGVGAAEEAALETALQIRANPELSAENLVAAAGTGFLWGVGIEGGLLGLGRVGRAVSNTFRRRTAGARSMDSLEEAVEAAGDTAEGASAINIQRYLDDGRLGSMDSPVDRAAANTALLRVHPEHAVTVAAGQVAPSRATGIRSAFGATSEEAINAARNPVFVSIANDSATRTRMLREVLRDMQTSVSNTRRVVDGAVHGRLGRFGTDTFREAMDELPETFVQTAHAELRGIANRLDEISLGTVQAEGLGDLRARVQAAVKELSSEAGGDAVGSSERAFAQMDELANRVDELAIKAGPNEGRGALMAVVDDLRRVIHSPENVGEAAAAWGRESAELQEMSRRSVGRLLDELGVTDIDGIRSIDSNRFAQFMGEFADPVKGGSRLESVESAFRDWEGLVDRMDELGYPVGGVSREALEASQVKFRELANRIRINAFYDSFLGPENKLSALANVAGGGAGMLLAGPGGAAAGIAGTTALLGLFRPAQTSSFLSRLRGPRMASVVDDVAVEAATRKGQAFGRLRAALRSGTFNTPASVQARRGHHYHSLWAERLQNEESRRDEYDRSSQLIRQMAVDTSLRQEITALRIEALNHENPEVAAFSAMTMNRALDYLSLNLPRGNVEFIPGTRIPPSMTEIDTFMQRVQALEDPYIVIDQLAEGLSSPVAIDAVRNVYPQMYSDMMQVTLEEFFSAPSVAYPMRVQLSLMVGEHIDPTMNGAFVMSMQTHGAETSTQAGVVGGNMNGAQIDVSKNASTQTQRLGDN